VREEDQAGRDRTQSQSREHHRPTAQIVRRRTEKYQCHQQNDDVDHVNDRVRVVAENRNWS
jgi:hypothetical protein